jgi:hypothetical protein
MRRNGAPYVPRIEEIERDGRRTAMRERRALLW